VSVADRLRQLGVQLPQLPAPAFNYVSARQLGSLVFASGHTPTVNGELTVRGKLGIDVAVEQGREAARLCALNCLAAVAGAIGDLDRVDSVLKLTGYVASAPGFVGQSTVINGASVLIEELLGGRGRHARTVAGAYAATVRAQMAILTTLNAEIATLEGQVEAHFGQHPRR
jgi:enamine deaminase RidA (YjgF/YER057c/UK114 family)